MSMFPRGPGIWDIFNRATRVWVPSLLGMYLSMFVIASAIIWLASR